MAIPAIRLSGLFLALATLGFGILLQYLFYSTNLMFGLTTSGIPAPRPDVSVFGLSLASDKGFYYVLLIAAVLSTAVIMVIQRSRMGRLLGALADSPLALETQGATTNVVKVLVFCISAAFASLAGALIAVEFHYAVGANYDPFLSLVYVALVVIAIGGEPWYALHRRARRVDHSRVLHLEQRHHLPPDLLRRDGGGICRLRRAGRRPCRCGSASSSTVWVAASRSKR